MSEIKRDFVKADRICKRKEYLAISRGARNRIRTKNFLILLKPNDLPRSRLGITVTKKIGKAVIRNAIKRYVREFFRNNKNLIPKGLDVVVIAQRGAHCLGQEKTNLELKVLAEQNQV